MNPNKTNKLKLLIVGAFVAFSQFSFGQSSTYEKMLVSNDETSTYDVRGTLKNSSGNIVIYGFQTKNNYDPYIIEVDPATGDTLSFKDIECSLYPQRLESLVELSSGGYFGVGYTSRNGNDFPWIIKLDSDGDTVYTKSFHSSNYSFSGCTNPMYGRFYDVLINSSGKAVITGRNNGCGSYSTLIAQIDPSNGSVDWINGIQYFNNVGGQSAYSNEGRAIIADGSSYLVVGYGYSNTQKGTIIKFDSLGDTTWTATADVQELYDVIKASDGNYYASGISNPYSISTNAAMVKVSSAGSVLLTKHISPTGTSWNYGYSIAEGPNANEILIGGTSDWTNQSSDQTLHSVSTTGTINYSKHFGFNDWNDRTYLLVDGSDIYLAGSENWGWNAYENYGAYSTGNPPHVLRPTISRHNSDGKITTMFPRNNRNQTGTIFCQNIDFYSSPGYSNFNYTSPDISSNYINYNTGYLNIQTGGTVTITQDDKNGDTRSVTVTIEANPTPTIAGYDQYYNITTSACAGDSLLLVAGGGANSTYDWYVSGTSTPFASNDTAYVKSTQYIYLKETTENGCTGTKYENITISTDQVAITSNDYPQSFNASIGNGTDTNTRQPSAFKWAFNQQLEAWIAPIGGYKQQNAQQYLVKASELSAMGLNAGSTLSKIGFDFLDGYTEQVRQFEIRIKPTTANSLTTWNSMSSVGASFSDYWYYPSISAGVNYFNLSNEYTWDGTSNLIIQFSYVNDNWASTDLNPRVRIGSVGFDGTLIGYGTTASSVGTSQPPSVKKSGYRPNIYFEAAKAPLEDTIVGCGSTLSMQVNNSGYQYLQWSTGSTQTSINVTNGGSYIVQMLDANFCVSADTVEVLFSAPSITATATLTKGCDGDNSTLTASGNYDTYIWSNGGSGNSITVSETDSYIVTAFDEYSCTAKDTISVEFVEKPVLYVGTEASHNGDAITDFYYLGEYDQHHYYYYTITHNYTWDQAKTLAESMGGYLWSVNSAAEHAAVAQMYQSQSTVCCETFNGAYKEGGVWKWHSGEPFTYTNWANGQPDNPNGDTRIRVQWGWSDADGVPGQWEDYGSGWDTQKFIIEFPANRRSLLASETFCDSVQIWTDQNFDGFTWSTGESDSIITVSASTASAITLTGTVNKSDGTTCSLTSDGTSITINATPAVSITNNTGTIDYDGTNAISLTAGSSGSNTTYEWSTGATTAAISVTAEGTYQVVGTENGCSDSVAIRIFEPVYVAKTGSDATGDGSFASPYLTINKGVDMVSDGGKVYVLPGVYTETVDIDKSLSLQSDFVRLNNAAAVGTTKINGNGSICINVTNETSELDIYVEGFTLRNGSHTSNTYQGALNVQNSYSTSLFLSNSEIIESATTGDCCGRGGIINIENAKYFQADNVRIYDNGSETQEARFPINFSNVSSGVVINDSRITDNGFTQWLFEVASTPLTIRNSVIANNYGQWSDRELFNVEYSNAALTLIHTTIYGNDQGVTDLGLVNLNGSNIPLTIYNSILGIDEIVSTNLNYTISNSLIQNSLNSFSGTGTNLGVNNVIAPVQINSDFSLVSSSPAIGIGSASLANLSTDIRGWSRPLPAGSNPDAGAFEDSLALGDFVIIAEQCGYLLEASVLNSSNHLIHWVLNGDTVSNAASFTATELGTYTVYAASVDRNSTISETLTLSDPLRFEFVATANNCEALSGNSGLIHWGGVTGGARNTVDWWEYRTAINNSNGSRFDGVWDIDENSWYNNRTNMPDGDYYVYVEDYSGCIVGDTVKIESQPQETYYVSATGSNANSGLSEQNAFATVAQAVAGACINDTIIILDGTYSEDSIFITRPIIIGSEFLIDGDSSHITNTVFSGGSNAAFFINYVNSQYADTTSMVISGFTIEDYSNPNFDQWYGHGGAISVWNSNVKIDHMIIQNNTARDGGGIGFMGHGFTGVVSNSIISGNHADLGGGGIKAELTGDLWIRNTQIDGNEANEGGGLWSRSWTKLSNVELTNNNAVNYGGFYSNTIGSSNTSKSTNEWSRIKVTGNVSSNENGGGRFDKSGGSNSFTLINALIADNTSSSYPGIVFSGYDGNKIGIINSTIYNNTGSSSGAAGNNNIGIWDNTVVRLLNTIVGRSGGSSGYAFYGFNCGTQYLMADASSVIEGGVNAIYDNPCGSNETKLSISGVLTSGVYFTDESAGDYTLASVSALLGQGSTSNSLNFSSEGITAVTLTAPSVDIEGNVRPNPSGSSPDVGAHESALDEPQIGLALVVDNNGFCQTNSASITANLLNYSGSATYSWSSSTYPTWTWNSTQTASGLSSGDYKVVASDATTGAKIDSTEITITTLPSISIVNTSNPVTCFGDDDGELMFEIYGGNPLGGSQYSYTVDYLQSMAQATGVVLPSNGYWFDSDNTSSNRTNKYNADNWNGNPIYQGKYYVSVTDQDGCTFTDTVEVGYSHELPVVNITTLASDGTSGLTSMCEGTGNTISLTANVTGGGGTNSFNWSNASTAQTVGVAQTDEYFVEVTDQYTCVGKDTIDIYFQSAPQLVVEGAGLPNYSGGALTGQFASSSTYLGSFNGSHYYYVNDWQQWETAKAYAESLGGHLARPESKEEAEALFAMKQSVDCCNGNYIDILWSNNRWEYSNGEPITFNYFQGNYQLGQGTYSGSSTNNHIEINGTYYGSLWYTDTRPFLIEFDPVDAPVTFNQAFCDSIELKAKPYADASGNGFSEIYWTDAQGDTVNDVQYGTFYADQDITLHGVFTRSDGQTCEMTSTTYSFDVFSSPNLVVTNYSGTADLLGGDTIVLVATTDVGAISWTDSSGTVTNNDTLLVTSPGIYVATAASTTCESTEEIKIDQPLYVAKTGNDATGDGTFGNPYLTIQKGVNQAASGQKIYVLPGIYNETVDIDKSVKIESDFTRLGNVNAKNNTVIDGNGSPCIEIENVNDDIVVVLNGFKLRDASHTSNSNQGAITINQSSNTSFKLMNSSITQSANSGDCCGRGGIIQVDNARRVEIVSVDIYNNGSLTQEARFPINLNWVSQGVLFESSKIRSNGFTQWLFNVYGTELTLKNTIIAENTSQWSDKDIFNLQNNTASLKMYHTTVYGNDQGQIAGLINIDWGDPVIEVYNSILDVTEVISTSEDYTVSNSVLKVGNVFGGTGSNLGGNNIQSNIQLQTGYSLPATSPAIGLGDISFGNVREDLNGWTRPLPAGSNPDAGAIEDSLAVGEFDFFVSNCGNYLDISVLNTDSYSINVSGPANFSSTNTTSVLLNVLGQYTVTVYDSLTSESLTKSLNYNNPLKIGFLSVQDACPSNGGYGLITIGEYSGGTRFNYPNDQYWAYTIDVIDSSGNFVANNWHEPDYSWHRNSLNVQSGVYTVIITDASGCSVTETVTIDDLIGSKYYISTTGSDTATGTYSDPLATIQEALNRTCDGDTIILFDGEYFENVDYTSSYLPYVTIASEFIEDGQYSHIANTIVNGMDEDPVFDISQHENSSDTIIFVGFTITNGKSSNWYGGGGISINYSEVALKDMVVTGNRSGHDGGGIGMDGGELNLWNTLIYDNIASGNGGGIRANYMERLDGHGSTIIENNKSNSSGGGISYGHGHWGSTEDFYIKGFEIINNSANYEGGGLHINNWGNNNSDLEIEDIKIINNRSNYGSAGGMYISNNGEDAIMSNVIIASNRSNGPGGMKINDVDLDIVHSTIYANPILDGTSSNDQIELHNNANVLLLNSAVGGQQNVGNSTAHTFYFNDWDTTCDLTIVNSLISGGVNSMDNNYNSPVTGTPIGQALYLVDPGQGDYMLSPVSQGLGAGVSTYSGITMPYIDIEGMARPNPTGSNPDVGAVESPLDTAVFGAAYEIRNNIACDPTYGRLKVIPLNGSGSYKYELDDLTGSATFSDQLNVSSWTYSSLYSGDYLVTITDLSSSSVFTDTVTITGKDSLNLILTYNDIFCAGEDNGSISAIVSGGDGYYDYTWTTATNSSWPKSNKLNNLYPDEYFVTVKDGDNCFIEDSVTLTTLHSLPAVTITGNINKGGSIVQTTNPQVRACAGDIVTLDAGAGFVSYNWTTIDQLNSWTTQTLSASYEDGFYVTVIDSFGCANSDTAQVFYVQSPSIFASNVNTNIGSSYQQVTSYVEGSNQSTGFNSEPKPYGASERFAKMQFIIPASELIAEGLTDQTSINSLGFEVDLASGSPVQNFKIKLKNTTSNQVGYTFETGLTEVYSFNILTAGEGWNTHEFDQDFVWDGTKNLLVQVEYSNVAFTNASNSYLIGHQTSYTSSSVVTNWSSSVSNQTTANNTFSWRPNMKFGIDKVQATDTLRVCDFTLLNTTDDYDTYSWLVNGTSQSTQLRYSMNSPNVVVLQTVDAASSCTMYSDTVQVLLDTTPSVFVTSPSLVGCIGDSVIASVDTVKSNLTYAWSNGVQDTIASFTESGDYYIYAISPSGCQGVDTVNVSINIPPDVVMELNGRVLTSTDGSLIADNSSCDTTLILPYFSSVDTLSPLNASEWDTYSSNFLEWEYQQGWDSLVDYTGPTYDADSNFYGGFYQFDPASLTDQNKVGYLELGCINLLGMSDPYISFAYHMVDVYADSSNTADQMGSLEFQVKTAGDVQWTTLWLTSGTEQAYTWVNKTIGLSSFSNQTIQVRWKGTAGVGGPRSEIGLDNVSVTDASANLSNVSGRISPETVCEGDSLFASTVSNGTSNFTFLWNNGETTSGIELHTSGWYSVQVTDDKSCGISTDSVYITVNPAPNNMLTLSDTTQYCFGVFDSIVISAVPGYANYEWIVGQQLSSPSATYCDVGFILTDSYGDGWNNGTIQIKDGSGTVLTTLGSGFTNGYSFIDSVSLVSGSSYTIDVANGGGWPSEMGLIVILGGDTIASYANTSSTTTGTVMATITPNCEIQGSTNSNVSLVSTIVVDSISLGTTSYYVTITDSIGCKATSEAVDLIERVNPALSFVSSPVLCNGDTTGAIDLTTTGNGGFVYDWSNGADSSSLSGLGTGWYSVAVTDSFSCETIDSVFVNEPTVLSLTQTITSDVNCFGGSDGFANYTFTGGVGGYVYSWSDSTNSWSSDSLNLTGAPAGLYFLNASDSNGCYVLDTVGIDEPSLLVLTIDSTSNLSCYQNADGYVSASVVGGFGSYSYYIDGMIATSLTIDSLNAGTHVVSVVDDNGCSDSASFTLTEPALLTATTNVSQYLGGIQVSCNGATDGSIDVFVNGGTLPYSFLWTDGDTTEDRSNIGAGTYSMTVTDEQGCTVTINEVITEPTLLVTASTVDSLDCYGASDGLINYTFSGATAPYITSWSSSTGSTVDSVLATFQVDMNGASINAGGIELITNSGFNYGMNVVSVLEDSIYRITIPVAVGTSIDYRFFNGSSPESVSSSCGVNIGGTFYRNVTINSDTTLVAVQFSSCTTVGSAYSGAMTGSGRTLTGLSAGSYSLSVSDVNGCATQMTDVLLQPDSISITAIVYDASCPQTPDGYVDVTATGGSGNLTYLWSTGDTTQDLTAAYGYHTIYVYDDKGCMDSATFLIDAPFPYNDEEICVVTVDTTGVNLVVWEKTPNQRTADYIILKENASSQYVSVGNNSYQNMSTWSDQNSNPKVQPWRYRLVLQDSCGNYSDTSDYHATIHLQASQGVAQNEVNLQWTAYEGKQVQTYYIYRWLSPINRVLIDSVSSNVQTYTDIYPVNTAITALLYEVGAKFTNGGCSPSAGKQSSYVTSMSNVLDWGTDGGLPIGTEEWVNTVLEHDLEMYPNPTQGKLNLDLKGAWEDQRNIQIVITDMTGRRIGERTLNGSGRAQFDFAELPAGVYFLQIITEEGRTIVKRFERIN